MANEEVIEEEVETSKDDTETPVEETKDEESKDKTTDEESKDAADDPAPAKPKKVDSRQKKIATQAYQLREKDRQIDRLLKIQEQQASSQTKADIKAPNPDDYKTLDEYIDAKYDYRDRLKQAKSEEGNNKPSTDEGKEAYLQETKEALGDLLAHGQEKYEDFEEMVEEADAISVPMRDAIFSLDDLDNQVDVTRYLCQNQKVARRIYKLSPIRQVAEIGKLEERLTNPPTQTKRPSAAPKPIKPVGGAKTPSDGFIEGESFQDFMKKRNKQLGRT